MAKGFVAEDYPLYETGVSFHADNAALQRVFDRCEALCRENLDSFGDKTVLKEGAKYNGVWLETQPMGGEMYAKRDLAVALNNQLIFFENQRRDGRFAGMITYSLPFSGLCPHYSWMQGNFLPRASLKIAYLLGKNRHFLELLYSALQDYDSYLWSCRDSDGDGCLETWCMWDTGDDNCTKYLANGVHASRNGSWFGEKAPYGVGKLPFESAEYMAYSYANRSVLAEVSALLGNGKEAFWNDKAEAVRGMFRARLWDEAGAFCFDRDCDNQKIDCLSQQNIKCMYEGIFTQEMADEFILKHLMNPEEFATPLPLPSIAANNPYFYLTGDQNNCTPAMLETIHQMISGDSLDNSWSGPCEGLTYQRVIDALLNYGHHAEVCWFGQKWLANLAETGHYVQQYDPFTGKPGGNTDGYGPTLLAALEYFSLMFGVNIAFDQVAWSSVTDGSATTYTQRMAGHEYTAVRKDGRMTALIDGKAAFSVTDGIRVYTDESGAFSRLYGIADTVVSAELEIGGVQYRATVHPNEEFSLRGGALVSTHRVPFSSQR